MILRIVQHLSARAGIGWILGSVAHGIADSA